jgi:drug/metabolite transporter (DMT)-like permease
MMAGVRFLSAGGAAAWLLATGHKLPARKPLLNAALIGVLLPPGNGFVTLAEHQHVPSGIAAVMVATVPLFTLCFSRFLVLPPASLSGWVSLLASRDRTAQQRRQPER